MGDSDFTGKTVIPVVEAPGPGYSFLGSFDPFEMDPKKHGDMGQYYIGDKSVMRGISRKWPEHDFQIVKVPCESRATIAGYPRKFYFGNAGLVHLNMEIGEEADFTYKVFGKPLKKEGVTPPLRVPEKGRERLNLP